MNTRLFIKNFSLNQGRLGDLNIYGEWDNEIEESDWMHLSKIFLRPRHVSPASFIR